MKQEVVEFLKREDARLSCHRRYMMYHEQRKEWWVHTRASYPKKDTVILRVAEERLSVALECLRTGAQ